MYIKNPTQFDLIKTRGIIYLIRCSINRKIYVGRAKNGFWERYTDGSWWKHTSNYLLKIDSKRYGVDKFEIEILNSDIPECELDNWEDYTIKIYDCLYPKGYNLVPGGKTKKHTEITCDKLSVSHRKTKYVELKNHRTGEIFKVVNLSSFSKKMGLSHNALKKLSAGSERIHRGFSLLNQHISKWTLKSEFGNEFIILEGELRGFCRYHKLSFRCIKLVLSNRQSSHRRWTCSNAFLNDDNFYYIRSPYDKLYRIGLRFVEKFARTQGVNPKSMRKLVTRSLLHCNGWTMADKGMGFISIYSNGMYNFAIQSNDVGIYSIPVIIQERDFEDILSKRKSYKDVAS